MTTVYVDSPYGVTMSVSGSKQAMTSEWLQQCAAFTNGGTIPFWIRYQYKVNYIITGGTAANPTYGGWGPLDETVDKINAIPGLRIMLPIQQFPQFMLRIDGTGHDLGYGGGTPTDPVVLPRYDDFARVSEVIATRYGNRIHIYQIANEEYDIQAHNGAILAPVFNAAYPAIKRHSSSPVIMGAVRKLPPGGSHVSTWMNNFVNYVPKISAGESPQAIPDGCDFHYYRDGSLITLSSWPAPDSATTDNSSNPSIAAVPSVPGEYSIIRPILDTLTPDNPGSIPIMNNEFGWDNSNNASIASSYPGTTPPWYVSRYTLTQCALEHFAGVAKSMQFTIGQYTDAKTLHRQGLIDWAAYIAANPQYTPGAAPTAYLYQTIDQLDFEGGADAINQTTPDQYFGVTNPTGSNKAWSVANTQGWLTIKTIATNGTKGTNEAGLTSGTLTVNPLTPGQCLTIKASVDLSGLATLTPLSDTITVTVGANVSTIAVNLWVNPSDAIPHMKVDQGSIAPTATVNGSNPAGIVVNITNAGNYKHKWYGYTQAKWLSLSSESGTLNAGASTPITISCDITGLAPGQYMESAYFCLTPFPTQYKNDNPPPWPTTNPNLQPEYANVLVNLKVTASTAPQVQLSTQAVGNAMYFTAGASGSAPPGQTFFIDNCTKSAQDWTVSAGSYSAGATGWLTLSPTSGHNLPASGSQSGTSPNVQSTDYTLVTATINNTALTAGTYTATVTCTLGGSATATMTVTYVVTSTSPTVIIGASPTTVSTTQVVGGTAVTGTTKLTNSGNTDGTWTKVRTYTNGTGWLTITPGTGALAASGGTQDVTFTCAPGTLAASSTPYSATVVFTLAGTGATSSTVTVTVNFTVTSTPTPGVISANPTSVSTSQVQSGSAVIATSTLTNTGGSSGSWTSSIAYTHGTGFLAVSPGSGTLAAGANQTATFTCTPGSLVPGTYTANVTFTMGSTTAIVAVSFIVTSSPSPGSIAASPTSVSTTQVQGGSAKSASVTLSNTGGTDGSWTSTTTYTHGSGWLAISPASGTLTAGGGTQTVTLTCTPGTLLPDTYTATVTFTLGSTTATVSISFIITASTTPGVISASPASLSFTDTIGQGTANPQNIVLSNTGSANGIWTSTIVYHKGNAWISLSSSSGSLNAGASQAVAVSMSDTALAIGVYTATITFTMGSTTASVAITLIIDPSFATSGTAQMTAADLAVQYQRIMSTIVGPQLSILAFTYYGNATNNQIIYGELDALFPYEQISQLHVMKSINDVTNFLNAYAYVSNVLFDAAIVYYRLGETSGVAANDISGRKMTGAISNSNGTLTGVTLGQTGALTASTDTAYLFDGSTGNISLPAGVNTANWASLSVDAWINLSNTTFTQTAFILANDAPSVTNLGFMLGVKNNAVIFRIGTGSTYYEINQAFTFVASTWYHLAATFNGTSLIVYLNGNQIATLAVTSALVAQTTNVMTIGARPGSTANNFPGLIDEPALYNTALSATRVLAHYQSSITPPVVPSGSTYIATILGDSPVAYYRMNETSGTIAHDQTSSHYDATLAGSGLTYNQTGITTTDNAIGFGATDTLTLPFNLNPSTWSALSLEYWINLTSGYQHIVIAGDTSGTTIYLNGAVYTSGSGDVVIVDGAVYYSGSSTVAGTLDEIALYNYVLSPTQVSNHYNVGLAGV